MWMAVEAGLSLSAEVKEVEMLPVPDHSHKPQQLQAPQPGTPASQPGTVVNAASFAAEQQSRRAPQSPAMLHKTLTQPLVTFWEATPQKRLHLCWGYCCYTPCANVSGLTAERGCAAWLLTGDL